MTYTPFRKPKYKNTYTKECVWCGNEFTTGVSRTTVCSNHCRERKEHKRKTEVARRKREDRD